MINRIISGVLLVLLLVGCQTLSERKRVDALQEVLRNYEGVIRWGSAEGSRRFLRPDAISGSMTKPAEEMRVTHYEVLQGPSMVEDGKAIQTAVIQYVFVASQVVREVVDQQIWEFDPKTERWYLISPLPDFK